jgi:hypothetical protein
MEVYNALDLKKGKKSKINKIATLTQPIQFLPRSEKDEDWVVWNMDWFEWQGLKQLKRNAKRLLKNYKLANGIIDKTDYIVEENNEYSDIVEQLTSDELSAFELKFYPIIPNVINTLVNEFSKRNTKLIYRTVDENSYNEMLDLKRKQIEEKLLGDAQVKLLAKLQEQGVNLGDPKVQEQMNSQLKSLPEIQEFYEKSYTDIAEEWAQHQYEADVERFSMDELEERGFRDLLITDREFWHFKMYENDYDVELWNPVLTFYQKSPDVRYISEGNWVGKVDMMTVADAIDKYGWLMTQEQLEKLEAIYPIRSATYGTEGYQNDGSFYDSTKSHSDNVDMPSLAYRQFTSVSNDFTNSGFDIVSWILGESEDFLDFGQTNLLRVTTVYWKSQRKVGYLTKIDELGNIDSKIIVDENYKITDKPIYNTQLFTEKTKDNLIYGEHIDWIWINEVWGGVKIGPNHSAFWGLNNSNGIDPIYLGINQNKIGKIKFQFKGDHTLYGCKLPVEGAIFTDRNSKSVSCVDQMKPWQIAYNLVNNQIADILVDELGTVIALDQNALPKHSMGEDWGKNNYAKAYVAMKDFQMLPLDTTITNTENPLNFQHYQVLNLEQTNRLMSRVNLANYFKQQAFEVIGVSPQRMGQQIEQNTAEGVRAAINNSYAQTEQYFIQHSDYLMPRVHQMRTDLAQFYQSTNPSVRLQYLTSSHEKINFKINGTDLLLKDINVYSSSKSSHRAVMERLRQLAIQNNTTGASIYDLGNIIKADSIPEITEVMRQSENKLKQQKQQEQEYQQQMQKQQIEAQQREKQMELDFKAMEAEKERRKDILVAEIKAAGYGSLVDLNKNNESDYVDAMKEIRGSQQYQEQTSIKREVERNKQMQHREKINLEREKLNTQKKISEDQLRIARENKNRFDFKKPEEKKEKNNKKKK